MFDVQQTRKDFAILDKKVYGKPLVYFDNAASSQKPLSVTQSITDYYNQHHSNIHRAFHYLGDNATLMYELARLKISNYINANSSEEVIFTRGTTESINLVATSLERSKVFAKNDEIVLTVAEHHSNIVPWQILAGVLGVKIKVINLLANGELDTASLIDYVNANSSTVKLVTLSHVYNGTGVINPVGEITAKIKNINQDILVLLDGAQAAPNVVLDVQALNCDFYAFSGHKMYGPTGIGILYGKKEVLNTLPPYHGGGEMIDQVILPMGTTYAQLPQKYEAGTPNIAGAIGLGAAVDYLDKLDFRQAIAHKNKLLNYCTDELKKIANLTIIGDSPNKAAVIAFTVKNINPQDVGLLLDQYGIAVRTGHHCNMPLMSYLGISGTIRASFGIYNTIEEVDIFLASLKEVIKILNK